MKYFKINKISNVLKFEKFNKSIVYSIVDENNIYKLDSENKIYYKNDLQIKSFTVFNNDKIIIGENKIFYKSKLLCFKDGEEFLKTLDNNENILIKNIDFEKEKIVYFLYNYKDSSRLNLQRINFVPKKIYKHFIIGVTSGSISIYDIKKLKTTCVFDLMELLEIKNSKLYGTLQIIGNRLFFFLFDSSRQTDTKATFCIEIETGTILWKSYKYGGWLKAFNEKIYNLHIKTIEILHPNTFEIKTIDLTEQLKVLDKKMFDKTNTSWDIPFRFSVSNYVIEENLLYFSQDKQNTVGLINLDTKELEWHTEIENESNKDLIITDLKVSHGNLYVLDNQNTLHIYQKEKNQNS